MSEYRVIYGDKFTVEPTVSIFRDAHGFTLDHVKIMFDENDRWLAEFIFNNFGKAGCGAMERLYVRLREVSVVAK